MNKNPERPENMEEIFVETISPEQEEEETQQKKVNRDIKKAVFGE